MPEVKSEPVIQQICKQIAAEENPSRVQHLVRSLQNTVEIEREETRLRLRWIARQYFERVRSAPSGTKMLDVISFLGVIPRRTGTDG